VPSSAPSTHPDRQFNGQPRHVSGASVESEATFPVRADAYLATDLSPRPQDDMAGATSTPPALPYPSLASAVSSPPPSMRSMPLPISSTLAAPGKSGGFFASLGRKSSVSREKRSPGLATRVLSKQPPAPPAAPRMVQMTSAPVVRGGPRAAPGRVKRSQTEGLVTEQGRPLVISPPIATVSSLPIESVASPTLAPAPVPQTQPQQQPLARAGTVVSGPRALGSKARTSQQSPPIAESPHSESSSPPVSSAASSGSGAKRRSSVLKRPSVWGRSEAKPAAVANDPDFARQVNKLAEVLPQADKEILAGYLRRAGQDVVAIGQYLEDDRNGRLRRD
jgi:hypothetical protein